MNNRHVMILTMPVIAPLAFFTLLGLFLKDKTRLRQAWLELKSIVVDAWNNTD